MGKPSSSRVELNSFPNGGGEDWKIFQLSSQVGLLEKDVHARTLAARNTPANKKFFIIILVTAPCSSKEQLEALWFLSTPNIGRNLHQDVIHPLCIYRE